MWDAHAALSTIPTEHIRLISPRLMFLISKTGACPLVDDDVDRIGYTTARLCGGCWLAADRLLQFADEVSCLQTKPFKRIQTD